MSVSFLLTSLIIIASPGTGVLLTLAAGLSRGARAASIAALGCTLGIIPHLLAALTGLAALLHTRAPAFAMLQYAGVIYLLYMAWMTLQEHGALKLEHDPAARSSLDVIRSAILANVLNPKLTIFFFAFLPQFIGRDEPHPLRHMVELSLVFMALTLVVFVAYGAFAAAVRNHIVSRPRVLTWMRRAFALALIGLAGKLALMA